jgi:hypothetical protein
MDAARHSRNGIEKQWPATPVSRKPFFLLDAARTRNPRQAREVEEVLI